MKIEVRVFTDRMELVGPSRIYVSKPEAPYRGGRILIGYFKPAEDCLRSGLRKVGALGWFKPKPHLIVRAMELNEGGLSEIEEKVLLELAYAAGARKASVA